MKRIIFFLIMLMSTCGRLCLAQESPPPSQYLKSVNAQFYLDTRDSSVWHFKGQSSGWAKLGRYKDIAAKLNINDTTALLQKQTAVATYSKLAGGNNFTGPQYFSNNSTTGFLNGSRYHGEAGYVDVGVNTEVNAGLNRALKLTSGTSGKYLLARGDSLSNSAGHTFLNSGGAVLSNQFFLQSGSPGDGLYFGFFPSSRSLFLNSSANNEQYGVGVNNGFAGINGSIGGMVTQLRIDTTGMVISDAQKFRGVVYNGDYESNFVDRSLISKQYADNKFATSSDVANGYVDRSSDQYIGGAKTFYGEDNYFTNGLKIGALNDPSGITNMQLVTHDPSDGRLYGSTLTTDGTDIYKSGAPFATVPQVVQRSKVSNGLFFENDTLKLGGSLTENTYINTGANNFIVSDGTNLKAGLALIPAGNQSVLLGGDGTTSNFSSLAVSSSGVDLSRYTGITRKGIVFGSSGMFIIDQVLNKGLEYEGDYEANFTNRSLITKQYADNKFATIAGHPDSATIAANTIHNQDTTEQVANFKIDGVGYVNNLTAKYSVAVGSPGFGSPFASHGTNNIVMFNSDFSEIFAIQKNPGEVVIGGVPMVLTSNTVIDAALKVNGSAVAPTDVVRLQDLTAESTTVANTYLAKSGGTMTGWVTLPSANPTDPLHAAPKAYIDNAITGITWKNAVRVKTTGNIALSGTQTIDGVSVVAGNRVLVNSQTDQAQNGIYIVAAGAWTRPTDADSGEELWTSTVAVTAGTQNRNTQWTCLNTSAPAVGSDAVTYGQISGAGTYAASSGVSLSANVFTLDQSFTRGLFSATGPLTYNSSTGAFGINQASGSQDGYLSSANWTTFNNKQNAITLTAGQVGYSNGSTLVGSSNITWDDTNVSFKIGTGAADANATLKVSANGANKGMVVGTSAYPAWMGTNGLFVDGNFRAGHYFINSGGELRWGASQAKILGYNPSTGSDTYLSFYTGGIATNGERMRIIDNGNIGIGTTAPTHTITLPSTTTGIAHYNTVDQTTNYERFRGTWLGNTYTLITENAGTGVVRDIAMQSGSTKISVSGQGSLATQTGIEFRRDNTGIGNLVVVASSGMSATFLQNGFSVLPTINQTGTGGYRMIFASPYEQATGNGNKYLIDLGTNTAANGSGTHTSKFIVDNTGAIISPSTGSHVFYNTTDQTTNYERVRHYWTSNTYTIGSEFGGTGAARTIQINAAATQLNVQQSSTGFQGTVEVRRDNTSTNTLFGVGSAGLTASAGIQTGIAIYPTINQSGTAGYRAIWVSALETATGSGNKYLMDLGTNSAANATGTHATKFTVDNNGNTVISGTLTSGGRRAAVTSVKTANYSALFSDEIIQCNSTAGSFNVTLLSTAPIGSLITIDNTDGTANSVTVVGTVNGATNYTLNATKTVTIYKTATGTNTWKIRSSN